MRPLERVARSSRGMRGRETRSYCRPTVRGALKRGREPEAQCWRPFASVEIPAHRVAVEACRLELTHDHADVLLGEILSAVARNRDDDAGFVSKPPMARSFAAEFDKAMIGQPCHERSAGHRAHYAALSGLALGPHSSPPGP